MKSGNQNLKRFIACVMTVVMVLTAVPFAGMTFSAGAEDKAYKEGYYTYMVENGKATIIDCDRNIRGDVVIPGTLGGHTVAKISDYVFSGCKNLTSIKTPNGMTSIGDGAFSECKNLTGIDIANSVKNIGWSAFEYCESLKSIKIPNGVTSIGGGTFFYCTSLTSVEIPKSVKSINNNAFEGCKSLTSINVSTENSKYSSSDGVLFNKDKTLLIQYPMGNNRAKYVIPNSVKRIGDWAFSNCKSLTGVTIGNQVKRIGENAFFGCGNLKTVTIPNNVSLICELAFGFVENKDGEIKKVKNFVIKGYTGSAAEKYAKENGLKFVSLKRTSMASCKFSIKSAVYTGKAVKPALTVKNGKTTLKAGTHYTVSYKNNTEIGKATVIIKGIEKNGYTGTKTLTFNIVPANVSGLKATPAAKSAKLSWNKVAGASGYVVYAATVKNGKYAKLAAVKGTSYTAKKLASGKTVYFKVAAYKTVGKSIFYGSFSSVKGVKAK